MADAPPSKRAPIVLRAPNESSSNKKTAAGPPSLDWLSGTWNVTHSTLPMWKNKRNVTITYAPLPAAGGAPARVDDLVQYEPLGPPWRKVTPSTVHGVDTALPEAKGWAWKWRGKGLLAVASSRWEVLGYGDEPAPPAPPPAEASPPAPMSALKDAPPAPVSALKDAKAVSKDAKAAPKDAPAAPKDEKRQWVVTYFASTLFTPAGIDVYSRHPDGLKPETMREIKDAFTKFEDPTVRRLADSLFEVEVKRESSS